MVKWSVQAKADLRTVHDFIAHESSYYSKKVTQDLVEKTDVLDELPKIGKVVAELGEDNVREVALYSYRILYEISDNDIVAQAATGRWYRPRQ